VNPEGPPRFINKSLMKNNPRNTNESTNNSPCHFQTYDFKPFNLITKGKGNNEITRNSSLARL